MDIIIADRGLAFDGKMVSEIAMGGAESTVAWLAEALVRRGHRVRCYTRCERVLTHEGVEWLPLSADIPQTADLFIANRGHHVLRLVPLAKSVAFWVHNPAQYLMKLRYFGPLLRRRPKIVLLSHFHAATLPMWIPGKRVIIPHGVHAAFRCVETRTVPPPRAVFISNPLRSLDPLLDMWVERIRPAVPEAELHLFTGKTIMSPAEAKRGATDLVLERARALSGQGVVLIPPLAREALAVELKKARILLYPAQVQETFCLSVAEGLACGLPAVVSNRGALPERVISGKTGFIFEPSDKVAFSAKAIELLTDDAQWLVHNRACLAQPFREWDAVASDFERLV